VWPGDTVGTIITKVDDLDLFAGVPNPAEAEETVAFNMDHTNYFLELSGEHAEQFREAMRPFVEAASKIGSARIAVPGGVIPPKPKPKPRPEEGVAEAVELDEWYRAEAGDSPEVQREKKEYRQAVRRFWRERGHDVGANGRVPRAAYAAFAAEEEAQRAQYLESILHAG
jgi:sugar phosphate isomerase/epimerase